MLRYTGVNDRPVWIDPMAVDAVTVEGLDDKTYTAIHVGDKRWLVTEAADYVVLDVERAQENSEAE